MFALAVVTDEAIAVLMYSAIFRELHSNRF